MKRIMLFHPRDRFFFGFVRVSFVVFVHDVTLSSDVSLNLSTLVHIPYSAFRYSAPRSMFLLFLTKFGFITLFASIS